MPQVKGLRLPKIKAQPPVTNKVTPLAGGRVRRRPKGYGDTVKPVTVYSEYIGAHSSLPIVSERAASELRSYRRDLAMCNADVCECVCYCHSGNVCSGPPVDRVHTPGHKKIYPVVDASPLEPCPVDGLWMRHRHEVGCHDRIDQTESPRHERKL